MADVSFQDGLGAELATTGDERYSFDIGVGASPALLRLEGNGVEPPSLTLLADDEALIADAHAAYATQTPLSGHAEGVATVAAGDLAVYAAAEGVVAHVEFEVRVDAVATYHQQ